MIELEKGLLCTHGREDAQEPLRHENVKYAFAFDVKPGEHRLGIAVRMQNHFDALRSATEDLGGLAGVEHIWNNSVYFGELKQGGRRENPILTVLKPDPTLPIADHDNVEKREPTEEELRHFAALAKSWQQLLGEPLASRTRVNLTFLGKDPKSKSDFPTPRSYPLTELAAKHTT